MKQETLSKWLKIILVGVALCGMVVYGYVIPDIGKNLLKQYPEFSQAYPVWLIFLLLTAIPCYGVLICGWKMASEIGNDRSFSRKNAKLLQRVCGLTAADTGFFFLGNILLWLLGWNHPAILLGSMLIVFARASIAIIAAGVSHLVYKAALMKEESELTI